MVRKIVLLTIFAIPFAGCDDDFRQGNCEEGFYQQTDGNGGYFCAPIHEADALDSTVPNVDIVNDTE